MRRLRIGVVLGVLVCATAAFAQQGTSEIGGKVIDAQGGVLPGVAIVVTNEDTGLFREVVTGPGGSYFVSQMVPGRYRITGKLEGFKSLDRRGIVLLVGQTTTLDLTLEVGVLTESVTVTGESPLIDLSTTEVGGHISSDELQELPAANRNYMAFVGNVPGTVFVPSAEFLNDSFQANGQPTAANNIIFDGANNTDEQRGSNVGGQTRAANESIQEVQVITNQFDAEYGRASGAVINAVTKSGTNQFTGSAFGFFTGKAVTARDFFADAERRREARRRQAGMGRHVRWADQAEQAVLLRQPRAARGEAKLVEDTSRPARIQLLDRQRGIGLEHALAHRPPAQPEPHVGVPLAARGRAAVQPSRRRPGNR